MKTFLVVNPQSANGQTGRRWPELSAGVSASLGEFAHAFTNGPLDATRLTQRALEEGHQLVVAVGGDGTINEVVNGFFVKDRPVRPDAMLGVLPRGTGGDFRKTFGWSPELSDALQRFKGSASRPLDVGRLEYVDHQGRPAVRYFANICSFGVSGQVDKEVNRSSKALGGKLSFAWGSLKALLKYSDRKVEISLDGKAGEEVSVTTLAVANGRYFGGGMCVAPDADPSDGWFDVTLWSGYGLVDFVFKSGAIYDGSHVHFKGTRRMRCQRLAAKSSQEVLLDVDGEQPGRLPCSISILPGAIRLQG